MSLMRTALLAAADNRSIQRFMYRYGMSLGARRFVAGETLAEFLEAARLANDRGFWVAAGLLGEGVQDEGDAARVVEEYRELIGRLASGQLRASIALKLTHLGLGLGRDLALANLRAIIDEAARAGVFVRIDMEQSAYTDDTIWIYRQLLTDGRTNVGTVLQAYLRRSSADLAALIPFSPNLRIVKGAYLEPPELAYQKRSEISEHFQSLIEESLTKSKFTAIATHDEDIIERSIAFITERRLAQERFEFQMLYGVRPKLQSELRDRGFRMRLAIPFGSEWYPYLMRRLAERPANLFFFLGTVWRK